MNLSEALSNWVELSGVDPSDKKSSQTYGDWTIAKLHEYIKEAFELESTNTTGLMLFEYIVKDYFKDRTFSVEKILNDSETVKSYIDKSKSLLNYLNSDEVSGAKDQFRKVMLEAVKHNGFIRDDLLNEINNDVSMAIIRRDALRSVNNLKVHQFLKGDFCSNEVRPVFGKHLYRWWNINSMLRAMVNMPNGITLNLICNPDGHKTFFCFCIKNGGNLFVFTDKSEGPHPLYEDMIRRPDKYLAERALRNYFPYSKAGMKFEENGGAYVSSKADSTSLVPIQSDIEKLCQISDLESAELIWISLMFSLIIDKFWKGKYEAPALSHTGEMLKVENKFLLEAKKANLPIILKDHEIPISEISAEDVYSENVNESDVGKVNDGMNRWLELRYRSRINKNALNLSATNGVAFCFDRNKNESRLPSTREDSFGLNDKSLTLINSFNLSSFGTQAELKANRIFIARHNYAKLLQLEADQEFKSRENEIREFAKESITKNSEKIFRDIVNSQSPCEFREFEKEKVEDFMYYSLISGSVKIFCEFRKSGGDRRGCFITGAKWDRMIRIVPKNAEQLAYLFGIKIDELPDVLQQWNPNKEHCGNHILDRIDPLEWALSDPWSDAFKFTVCIFLSKRGRRAFDVTYK